MIVTGQPQTDSMENHGTWQIITFGYEAFHSHGGTPRAGWCISRKSHQWMRATPIYGNLHIIQKSYPYHAKNHPISFRGLVKGKQPDFTGRSTLCPVPRISAMRAAPGALRHGHSCSSLPSDPDISQHRCHGKIWEKKYVCIYIYICGVP